MGLLAAEANSAPQDPSGKEKAWPRRWVRAPGAPGSPAPAGATSPRQDTPELRGASAGSAELPPSLQAQGSLAP